MPRWALIVRLPFQLALLALILWCTKATARGARSCVDSHPAITYDLAMQNAPKLTGLSGNEIYCMRLKGFTPSGVVIGNSIQSMGFLGGVRSAFRGIVGGEIPDVTQMIHEGRAAAFTRMRAEADREQVHGVVGVNSELRNLERQFGIPVRGFRRQRRTRNRALHQRRRCPGIVLPHGLLATIRRNSCSAILPIRWAPSAASPAP